MPIEGLLALMWDIDPAHHRQVITSLRNRSLVESYKGHYWLHPVVQAEASERLQQSGEATQTHTQARQFWTQHVTTIHTIAEATQACEAYYHALAITDYAGAAEVLLNSRHNQWGQHLTLGSTLYRMGLLQPAMTAISTLLPHLPQDQRASELRNILADVYWISGKIHAAISMQKQAQTIARQGLDAAATTADDHEIYCWRMLEVDALLSLGLYHLDLWELADAAGYFRAVITAAKDTPQQSWADKAALCLALVASHRLHDNDLTWGDSPQAIAMPLAEQAYGTIADTTRPEYTGRFAFFIQLSCINFILYYAPELLELAGLGGKDSLFNSISIGIINMLFTFIGLYFIDRMGRRMLMYIGSVGYIVSLAMTAFCFYADLDPVLLLTSILIFIASHAVGQGAVIWVFISEIFPNEVRAKGQSLGTGTHWVFAALITLFTPIFIDKEEGIFGENPWPVFGFFALMMVLQLLFVKALMPETKGKTLEELAKELMKK